MQREQRDGLAWWTDREARSRGIAIAFSERTGGVSEPPYASLDLAAHTGDEPGRVDQNRRSLLCALGMGSFAGALTVPEQVHGVCVAHVGAEAAGSGGSVVSGRPPVPAADALVTALSGVPLLLCFADCVPVVLVAPGPAIAVVHAGWRGALGRVPGRAAEALATLAGCRAKEIIGYIGPHICAGCYQVGDEIMSQFLHAFGTVAQAESEGLDLGAIVNASLTDAGVPPCSIASLGACTAEETDRWFSYRAEGGRTGRHGAIACILP